jgi:hypothetical protein
MSASSVSIKELPWENNSVNRTIPCTDYNETVGVGNVAKQYQGMEKIDDAIELILSVQ